MNVGVAADIAQPIIGGKTGHVAWGGDGDNVTGIYVTAVVVVVNLFDDA